MFLDEGLQGNAQDPKGLSDARCKPVTSRYLVNSNLYRDHIFHQFSSMSSKGPQPASVKQRGSPGEKHVGVSHCYHMPPQRKHRLPSHPTYRPGLPPMVERRGPGPLLRESRPRFPAGKVGRKAHTISENPQPPL